MPGSGASEREFRERLTAILRSTPPLIRVLSVARHLCLPDWLVFSDAVYQPVLNHLTGRARCQWRGTTGCRTYGRACDVPVACSGFSRLGWGFQHNRTHIAADIFTPSSIGVPREVANQVIRTVALSDNIRLASAVAPDLRGYGPGRGHDGRRRGMRPWKSGSHETPRWSKPDSNSRSHLRRYRCKARE
jgi:hypothetical protein